MDIYWLRVDTKGGLLGIPYEIWGSIKGKWFIEPAGRLLTSQLGSCPTMTVNKTHTLTFKNRASYI